jgi:hypothetical protein
MLQHVLLHGSMSVMLALSSLIKLVPRTGLLAPEALDPRPFLETLDRWGVRLRFQREIETDHFL